MTPLPKRGDGQSRAGVPPVAFKRPRRLYVGEAMVLLQSGHALHIAPADFTSVERWFSLQTGRGGRFSPLWWIALPVQPQRFEFPRASGRRVHTPARQSGGPGPRICSLKNIGALRARKGLRKQSTPLTRHCQRERKGRGRLRQQQGFEPRLLKVTVTGQRFG